jgi:phosphoribosylaminoimidazolecarboxamide formyltransferase/IMP cyclohydrolase
MKESNKHINEINKYFAKEAANTLMNDAIGVNNWFNEDKMGISYEKVRDLRYGMNPSQSPAYVFRRVGSKPTYDVLNGTPGYINLLDANNAIKLVTEVKLALGIDCCASFKHNSPAGVGTSKLNLPELIYSNTVKIDPLSSYGDFLAFSGEVNLEIAELLQKKVSDGIIAPRYEKNVLEMLQKKKKGNYIVMQQNRIDTGSTLRDVNGDTLIQPQDNEVPIINQFDEEINKNLVLGGITLKYTQSNSICFVYRGQVIGIGAGQQNRIDCIRIAGNKALAWFERMEIKDWSDELCMVSDGFLPFADNIEEAIKYNVKYISQPGGSMRDDNVVDACKKNDIEMIMTGKRLFTH